MHAPTNARARRHAHPRPRTLDAPPPAQVVNYPFDAYNDWRQESGPSTSPDDATYKYLARTYSTNHAFMSQSEVGFGAAGGLVDSGAPGRLEPSQRVALAGVHELTNRGSLGVLLRQGCRPGTRPPQPQRRASNCNPRSPPQEFKDGITNGAEW